MLTEGILVVMSPAPLSTIMFEPEVVTPNAAKTLGMMARVQGIKVKTFMLQKRDRNICFFVLFILRHFSEQSSQFPRIVLVESKPAYFVKTFKVKRFP